MKKNILIIGPFDDKGGREIETGFIANSLIKFYNVEILTVENYFENSDVLYLNNKIPYTGLNKTIFETNRLIRFFIRLILFFKRNKISKHFFVSNRFVKKVFDIEGKRLDVIKKFINKNDLIFICAQPSSNYIKEIIELSFSQNKTIFFRTTGLISHRIGDLSCLFKKVNCFIHHSILNTVNFEKNYFITKKYRIIDQCSLIEDDLLDIPVKKDKINTFLSLSRLSEEKQVNIIIEAFKKVGGTNDKLIVCGNGNLKEKLFGLAKGDKRIIFKGFMNQYELKSIFKQSICLIISSKEEAGPITGIEAMAAGIPIISTKVGAMLERLDDDCFWFDGSINGLKEEIHKVRNLNSREITEVSTRIRKRYLMSYTIKNISNNYVKVINKYC